MLANIVEKWCLRGWYKNQKIPDLCGGAEQLRLMKVCVHFPEAVQVANDSRPAGLVQVQVIEDQPVRANPGVCLTLSTPKGYRIELEPGFDADLLHKVLRIVETA
ncbi:hypothetical protein [Endozoicomonas sp. SCSIO W0465]|uniref:hypothetical protein n=1 Tax=Endozoicomonas sp. SCSIO W0465 TaxID=2918516 RepID=UPI00207664CC|nr:hypothetical protein [Endozoicomonas sp. SCSIO W0465]USE36607.1 hypothetical protein MJO57_32135 [Endozoicomonas sp. SCSIO W0465]